VGGVAQMVKALSLNTSTSKKKKKEGAQEDKNQEKRKRKKRKKLRIKQESNKNSFSWGKSEQDGKEDILDISSVIYLLFYVRGSQTMALCLFLLIKVY
jgi:hypothetical protein